MARIQIKVVPKASRDRVAGTIGDAIKVCVTAPPERGKANKAVAAVLAKALGVPRSAVRIVAGVTSQRKTVEIDGISDEDARARLTPS